jgi:hypothetical protein
MTQALTGIRVIDMTYADMGKMAKQTDDPWIDQDSKLTQAFGRQAPGVAPY